MIPLCLWQTGERQRSCSLDRQQTQSQRQRQQQQPCNIQTWNGNYLIYSAIYAGCRRLSLPPHILQTVDILDHTQKLFCQLAETMLLLLLPAATATATSAAAAHKLDTIRGVAGEAREISPATLEERIGT